MYYDGHTRMDGVRVHKGGMKMKQILIVVDMQNDFVDGALGTKEAVSIVDRAAQKIRRFQGDVFVTYDTHSDDYLQTDEGKRLPVPHCLRGTDGWQLTPCVARALENRPWTRVEKSTFGAVALPDLIRARVSDEPFSIELIGLCTDICVVSNALLLKAFFPHATLSVDASCCAGVTPQTHREIGRAHV